MFGAHGQVIGQSSKKSPEILRYLVIDPREGKEGREKKEKKRRQKNKTGVKLTYLTPPCLGSPNLPP